MASKKKTVSNILLTLAFVFLPQLASAQTNTFPSSGDVGVGTTTPDQYANIHISKGPSAGMDIQSSDTAGWARMRLRTRTRIWGWFAGDASQPDAPNKFGLFDYTAGAFRLMVDPSGNVGIGTTTPLYRFVIDGAAQTPSSTSGSGLALGVDSTYKWIQSYNSQPLFINPLGNNLVLNRDAGNVGIGTLNPVFDPNVTKYLTLDGGSYFGSIGVGGNITSTPHPVGQYAFFNSALGGSEKRVATIVGATDVATNSGKIDFWTTSAGSFGSGPKMTIFSNGNVGIGLPNPNPNYKLDVNGEINATGLRINGTPISGGGGSQWSGTSSIYYNGGNVGIGTATPGAKFEVDGSGVLRVTEGSRIVPTSGVGLELSADSTGSYVGAYNRSTSAYRRLYFYGSPYVFEGGNVGIGTTDPQYKLDVVGDIKASGTIHAKYQDLAEWVPSAEQLSAGTVVVLDTTKSNQVISSTQSYDTRVAGVISAQPGITLGEGGEGKVLVATTGRVRVKVDASRGAIQIGDLLVTSDVSGVAMKSEPVELAGRKMHMPGTIIGKALEPLAKGSGEILVLLSLQ